MTRHAQHPDDISIGRDEWIRFVDVSGLTDNAANMDAILRPSESFWRALEIHCVSECCGISAYSFWEQDIWNAVRHCHVPDLADELIAVRQHVTALSVDCLVSEILNQYFHRRVFLSLLDHVIDTVERM